MKILQLNLWNGRLDKHLRRFLERETADVLCLQEVSSQPNRDIPFILQLEDIQRSLHYEYVYFSPMFRYDALGVKIEFGNAILSRLPLSHTYTLFTRAAYNPDYKDGDDFNLRNLQHVIVEHAGRPLHLLNHHGHHLAAHKNGDTETDRQMRMIADYIEDIGGPIVLCGDFNLAPSSKSLYPLNKRLVNLPITHNLATTRPPITDKTDVCDYIFTSTDLKVKHFSAIPDIVSDHLALSLLI